MKQSPFSSPGIFVRVLIKALMIAVIVNIALLVTGFNPVRWLVNANTWLLVGHGRARLAYPSDFQNGQLPLESLLAAHAIHYDEKDVGEYRVVLLGESGIAGWGLEDDETLAAQLTAAGIEINGRRLAAYNLAYPQPGAARDLLILDAVMAYEPDLVIWFITPAALNDETDVIGSNRVFFSLNKTRLDSLAVRYNPLIGAWYDSHSAGLFEPEPDWEQVVGIRDRELLPVWVNTLFYPFIPPDLAISDRRMGMEPVPDEARYTDDHPGFAEIPNPTWNLLRAGCLRAQEGGAVFWLINEPVLVGSGGADDVNYNAQYQRALYDRYRETLEVFTDEYGIWYTDLWDTIPAEHFTDTPLHTTPEGQAVLAGMLTELLLTTLRGSQCD